MVREMGKRHFTGKLLCRLSFNVKLIKQYKTLPVRRSITAMLSATIVWLGTINVVLQKIQFERCLRNTAQRLCQNLNTIACPHWPLFVVQFYRCGSMNWKRLRAQCTLNSPLYSPLCSMVHNFKDVFLSCCIRTFLISSMLLLYP